MKRSITYKLSTWSLLGILSFLGFREFYFINVMAYVGDQNIWDSKRFIAFLIVSVLAAISWLGLGYIILKKRTLLNPDLPTSLPGILRWIAALLILLLPGLLKWILPLPADFTLGYWEEFLLIYCAGITAAWLLVPADIDEWKTFLYNAALVMAAGIGHAILVKLCQVTSYPFTLYWSEGNRFFDYSTLFGSYRYDFPAGEKIYAFISWGMQVPWALPFLLPNLSIGAFRLWYQLVWIIPPSLLGLTAAWKKPFKGYHALTALVFTGWTFLFLDQGPIYTPLILAGILTLLVVRAKLPLGIVLILITSYYARSARWTWSYSPGLWAGLLALLAVDKPDFSKEGIKKLVKPVTLGISGYLGGQILPQIIKNLSTSNVQLLPNVVNSASRQPLLWDRLFPNPTYAPGILYGLLWATLPLIVLLIALIIKKTWKVNWLQGAAMLAIAGAFLTSGLIASVKIGGGSNLHNLDNFLVTLVMLAAAAFWYFLRNKISIAKEPVLIFFTCLALVMPVSYTLRGGSTRLSLPSEESTQQVMENLQSTVEKYKTQGEVLFIDQRQLLTFGMINNIPLIDDYEKKYLMDQAMADNSEYFETFYQDLKAQRFVLIINEPSNYIIRGSEDSFGQENDAYVNWVTIPLLCTYEPIYTSAEVGVELLVPRKTPSTETVCINFLSEE